MKYRKDIGSLQELIEKANQDSDAASCFVNGEDWEHCDGVIIVVKGIGEAFRAANILANAGMRTAGKPVVDPFGLCPNCNLPLTENFGDGVYCSQYCYSLMGGTT